MENRLSKEHTISMTDQEMRYYMAGRMTQIRRPVGKERWNMLGGLRIPTDPDKAPYSIYAHETAADRCPYGKVADRLVMREAWKINSFMPGEPMEFQYRADGAILEENETADCLAYEEWYENTTQKISDYLLKIKWPMNDEGMYSWKRGSSPLPWRPSTQMPRWAVRATPAILKIRVERVQDINAEDALACGISETKYWKPKEMEERPFEEKWWDDFYFYSHYPQIAYKNFWIGEYGNFEANPWVWVLDVEGVKK